MTDSSLFTIQSLGTVSGCSLAVYLLVQLTKGLIDKKFHIHTDILAYLYSFIVLVLSQIAMGTSALDWKLYFLSSLNALIVAMTAAQIQSRAAKATGAKPSAKNNKNEDE